MSTDLGPAAEPIRFHCPRCDKRLKADPRAGGTRVTCPGCGHRFAVRPLGQADPAPVVSASAAPARPAGRGPSRRRWLIGGGALVLLVAAALVFLWLQRPRVLECVAHDEVMVSGSAAAGIRSTTTTTLLVKVKAGREGAYAKEDFKLFTPDGEEVPCAHCLFLEADRVNLLDPADPFADRGRAVLSFDLRKEVTAEHGFKLKYRAWPAFSLPAVERRTHSEFRVVQ